MKNREVVQRTWNHIRLALLWARKGGMLKLRVMRKNLKCLGHTTTPKQTHYHERELSFEKTPVFDVKVYRPSSMRFHVPCINPKSDFDDDQDFEYDNGRKSSPITGAGHDDEEYCYGYEEEGEIDKRAEEFIAKFYQQMKLQRQISYLRYNETPNRDLS